jgi:hypothetical protein
MTSRPLRFVLVASSFTCLLSQAGQASMIIPYYYRERDILAVTVVFRVAYCPERDALSYHTIFQSAENRGVLV